MTKKLSKWEKEQNKTRRGVLLQIKKLLKDKSIHIAWSIEHMIGRDWNHKIFYTGEHEVKLNWTGRIKK